MVGPRGRFSNFSAAPRWLSVGFSAVYGLKLSALGTQWVHGGTSHLPDDLMNHIAGNMISWAM
jgi:hypothetical protein